MKNTRAQAVRDALENGPATAFELSVELDWPVRIASAHVTSLLQRGEVEHCGSFVQVDGHRRAFLYRLKKRSSSS